MADEPRAAAAWPWLFGLVLLALQLSPLTRPASADSFPFSSFPMFAHERKDAITHVDRAIAFFDGAPAVMLPPRVLGTDEVLQAAATLRQAIRRGRKGSARLCEEIAARVAVDPAFPGATEVEVRSERYDAIAYFAGDKVPLGKPVRRARCKVTPP